MVEPFFRTAESSVQSRTVFDAGLRTHMQRVFAYMAGGVGLTGLVSYLVANTSLINIVMQKPMAYIVMFLPLAFILVINFGANRLSVGALQGIFWAFCTSMGLSLSTIFLAYTDASIARVFFITAANFGVMALWGYTTKRDLTSFGGFLTMGVFGLVIAGLVNLFLASPMIYWLTSIVGVLVFTGLTAFSVQQIKQAYNEAWGAIGNGKAAILGALQLYLNFVNAFMYLLRIMGNSRN